MDTNRINKRDFFGRPDTSVVKVRRLAPKVKLACLECGKRFSTLATNSDVECPKCHGVDVDVA
jgi:Zn finger protein HypA/HybF involved in hydrogenase expression